MNNNMNHWSAEDLAAFVRGRLTDLENETIFAHLEACEQCFTIVDGFWAEGSLQELGFDGHLDKDAAARLEDKLYRRIHRSQLAGDVVTLGARGMLGSVIALFASFLGMLAPSNSDTHKERKETDAKS